MSDCDEDNDSITVITETPPSSEGDAERLDTQHTVTFKCTGRTKEQNYVVFLASVAQIRHRGGDVRLEPEPTNPVDAKAIAFQSKLNGTWSTNTVCRVRDTRSSSSACSQ